MLLKTPQFGEPLGLLHAIESQMVDIDDAILSTTKIEPAKLSLGEMDAVPVTQTLTIANNGSSDVTYNFSHVPALSTTGSTFTPVFDTGFASVAFSMSGLPASSVTVPAGGTASVDVTITANQQLAAKSQYGGYIVFTAQDGGQVYRVPYAGFKGDYQSIQALVPTTCNFPWLARAKKGVTTDCGVAGADVLTGFTKEASGATYSMTDGDVPYILLHLDHQVRRLRMEVRDANTGESRHRALELEYYGRNSAATEFFAFPWDGTTMHGNKVTTLPNGQYKIVLSVQKALGDAANPAHWETWTSPAITIARP